MKRRLVLGLEERLRREQKRKLWVLFPKGEEAGILHRNGLPITSSISDFLEQLTRKEAALGCAGEEEVGSELVQLFGKTSTPGKRYRC